RFDDHGYGLGVNPESKARRRGFGGGALHLYSGKQPPPVSFEGDLSLVLELDISRYIDGIGVLFVKREEEEEKARLKEALPVDRVGASEEGGGGPPNNNGSFLDDKGIPITAKKCRSTGSILTDSPLSAEGPAGPLFLQGTPQVIDLEEDGDSTPALTSMGEPEHPTTDGDVALDSTSMGSLNPLCASEPSS
ncbi:hypothetical protein ACLOJK_026931, partial [Asimina triloba]